mmetsp:Transcript_68106/g.210716  ORF Transcript_68106/g.210716 Transcript_68106/m.210716 type:complete len:243 (-) Transcript_68106:485-1213(-)
MWTPILLLTLAQGRARRAPRPENTLRSGGEARRAPSSRSRLARPGFRHHIWKEMMKIASSSAGRRRRRTRPSPSMARRTLMQRRAPTQRMSWTLTARMVMPDRQRSLPAKLEAAARPPPTTSAAMPSWRRWTTLQARSPTATTTPTTYSTLSRPRRAAPTCPTAQCSPTNGSRKRDQRTSRGEQHERGSRDAECLVGPRGLPTVPTAPQHPDASAQHLCRTSGGPRSSEAGRAQAPAPLRAT